MSFVQPEQTSFENNAITSAINPGDTLSSGFKKPVITAKQDAASKTNQAPIEPQKPSMHLFSDEQSAYDKMKADGITDDEAISALKQRRKQLMGGNSQLTNIEVSALGKMRDDGLSTKEAIDALNSHRQDLGIKDKAQYDALPLWKKAGLNAVSAGVGAFETIGSSGMNILGWGDKMLGKGASALGFDSLGNKLNEGGQQLQDYATELKKAGDESFGNDARYSSGYKTGNVVGGAGMMVATPGASGLAGTTAGLGTKMALGAIDGGTQMAGMDIANKGETSASDVIGGALLGGSIPAVGKGFSTFKDYITSKLPQTLIAKGLTTPSALLNASERLSRLADDGMVDVSNAPQWMLDKGLSGSKKQIGEQLGNLINDSVKKKVEMFAGDVENGIQRTYENAPQVKELGQAMMEILPNFAKITKDEIIPTAGNAEKVNAILDFITKPNPTALDIDKARGMLGEMGIFTKGGALSDSAQKEGLQRVWVNASKFLDDTLPGFRAMNKDIEVANALRNAIGLKEAQDSVRSMMNISNGLYGGAGAFEGYRQGGIKGAVMGGIGAIGAKHLLNNPYITTNMAQWLSKIGQKAESNPTFAEFLKDGVRRTTVAGTEAVTQK